MCMLVPNWIQQHYPLIIDVNTCVLHIPNDQMDSLKSFHELILEHLGENVVTVSYDLQFDMGYYFVHMHIKSALLMVMT